MIRVRDKRLFVGSRDCSRLAEAMDWQTAAVARTLTAGGVEPLPPIVPVLCFVRGEWPLLWPPSEFRGVRLEGTRSIRKLLTANAGLDDGTLERIHAVLAERLR